MIKSYYFYVMISVVLLGAGNLANHLYQALKNAQQIKVVQWYNRSYSEVSSFKNEVNVTDSLENLVEADVYLLAISDDSIAEISSALPFENRLVVHTSGSVSIHQLDKKLKRGVFYPLQSFTKDASLNFNEVPICLEALDKESFDLLNALSDALGCTSYKISTEQRQTLHLCAVFVNNFVNQLYRVSHEISDAKRINFDILKPLILETAKKVQNMSPYKAQTGPAKRNDKKTIKRHLKQIENPEHKAIYELLTKAIKKTHGQR